MRFDIRAIYRPCVPPTAWRLILARAVAGAVLLAGAAPAFAQSAAKDTGPVKADPLCATYGADFQRVPGTTSCVRSGAAVRTDVYGGRPPGSAPNQFSGTPTGSAPTAADAAADPWKAAR